MTHRIDQLVDLDQSKRQCSLEIHQALMSGCRRCVDAGYIPTALPIFHGAVACRIMVVGQAPAAPSLERPLPYSGATGKMLQSWLKRAGFDTRNFHDTFYLTSLTKCFPGTKPGQQGDRAPSVQEIDLCRTHLEREVALVRPAIILPLGRLSITYFVSRKPLNALIGNVFERNGTYVLPLPHPSGVSRWLNLPEHRQLLDRALSLLSALRRELQLS